MDQNAIIDLLINEIGQLPDTAFGPEGVTLKQICDLANVHITNPGPLDDTPLESRTNAVLAITSPAFAEKFAYIEDASASPVECEQAIFEPGDEVVVQNLIATSYGGAYSLFLRPTVNHDRDILSNISYNYEQSLSPRMALQDNMLHPHMPIDGAHKYLLLPLHILNMIKPDKILLAQSVKAKLIAVDEHLPADVILVQVNVAGNAMAALTNETTLERTIELTIPVYIQQLAKPETVPAALDMLTASHVFNIVDVNPGSPSHSIITAYSALVSDNPQEENNHVASNSTDPDNRSNAVRRSTPDHERNSGREEQAEAEGAGDRTDEQVCEGTRSESRTDEQRTALQRNAIQHLTQAYGELARQLKRLTFTPRVPFDVPIEYIDGTIITQQQMLYTPQPGMYGLVLARSVSPQTLRTTYQSIIDQRLIVPPTIPKHARTKHSIDLIARALRYRPGIRYDEQKVDVWLIRNMSTTEVFLVFMATDTFTEALVLSSEGPAAYQLLQTISYLVLTQGESS